MLADGRRSCTHGRRVPRFTFPVGERIVPSDERALPLVRMSIPDLIAALATVTIVVAATCYMFFVLV